MRRMPLPRLATARIAPCQFHSAPVLWLQLMFTPGRLRHDAVHRKHIAVAIHASEQFLAQECNSCHDKAMVTLEVGCAGSVEQFCRPCVDCGRLTGYFCDGKDTRFFAVKRVPREEWCVGQRTPFCSRCEGMLGWCHYCRGVASCTPPAPP